LHNYYWFIKCETPDAEIEAIVSFLCFVRFSSQRL
jgi:hypothetical protein